MCYQQSPARIDQLTFSTKGHNKLCDVDQYIVSRGILPVTKLQWSLEGWSFVQIIITWGSGNFGESLQFVRR